MIRYAFTLLLASIVFSSPALAQQPPAAAPAVQTAPTIVEQAQPAAPAAAPAADWMNYKNPYVGEQNNIANPNRTPEEISVWVQKTAADALTFAPENIQMKLGDIKKAFSPQGWEQYSTYIQQSQLADMVQNRKLTVTSIFKGDANVINSASMAGSYHWLVRAPLMISFFKKNASGAPEPAGSGNFRLTVQVGRVASGTGLDGFVVESWKIETVN